MTCAPPPECAGRSDGPCAPPPWCTRTDDGRFDCKPPENPGAFAMGAPGAPCPPPVPDAPPAPCGPPGPPPTAACQPGPDGQVRCAPPPQCGGALFGGAGAAGCAPPDFCRANADGIYECKPPEDCRVGPDGRSRCAPPPTGAACAKLLEGEAASGAFLPCAPPPTQFCPPPPPGQLPQCGAPPPPPRPCAEGEAQFPPGHPTGAPPACFMAPKIENGRYVAPRDANAGCAPPPPGEWPPAQPAPEGRVWCPPQGFAPPPPPGQGFDAWQAFAKDKIPPRFEGFVFDAARGWDGFNSTALADITAAGAVHQLFAPPAFDGRSMNGSFTRATMDENMGVKDFRVGGTPFFRGISPQGAASATFATTAGTAVISANDKLLMESHNVPSGLLAYKGVGTEETAIHMELADVELSESGVEGLTLLQNGDWKGVVIGDVARSDGGLSLTVAGGKPGFFMAIPPSGIEADTRLDIAEGVAQGQVFAEVSLLARNETVAQDLTFYEDAEAFALDVLETAEDKIELEISGEGEGKAVVFTVDRETLTTPLSQLNVTMDGVLMKECASFDEMTESAAEGGCYHLAANETAVRVSIMPEHFSTHVIAIGAVEPDAPAGGTSADETPTPVATEQSPASGGGAPASPAPAEPTAPTATTPAAAAATPASATPTPDAPAKDTPGFGPLALLVVAATVALVARRRR